MGAKKMKPIKMFDKLFKEQDDNDKEANVFYSGVSDKTIIKFAMIILKQGLEGNFEVFKLLAKSENFDLQAYSDRLNMRFKENKKKKQLMETKWIKEK